MVGGSSLTKKGIVAFYLRRCFRILPMMWASLILTYALLKINHASPTDQVSSWYVDAFEQPIDFRDLLRNFFLVDFKVSPVTWTMRIELLGSLLMPAIVYAVSYSTPFQRAFLLGVLSALPVFTQGDFQYLVCFYVGALLTLKDIVAACVRSAGFLVIGGVMVCTLLRLSLAFDTHPRIASILVSAGAASILLGILGSSSKFGILETGPFRILGRLSYSLYLLHPAVLGLCSVAAFAIGIYPKWPAAACNTALFFISVTVALACSTVSYRWIEQPSIALGRALTKITSLTKRRGGF
jgi:peptidoglycan/LPS O-acetylase OafA/YrhL